jgi:hypothetical protein
MQLLALGANSVAQTTFDAAISDAGQTPTPNEQDKLAEAESWLQEGAHRLSAPEFTDAVRAFRFATIRALEVLEA